MLTTKHLAAAALAIGLAASSPAFAAAEHAHAGHGAAGIALTLNNGQKWPTDEPLRRGMRAIRSAVEGSIERIRADQLTSTDYASLTDRLQQQIDYVTSNCKLPEEADAQLHVVLAAMLEGMDAMRHGGARADGAARVIGALEAYGRHFDDPNWGLGAH